MPQGDTGLILRKLKKDGSLDSAVLERVVSVLRTGGHVVLPVDGIYASCSLYPDSGPLELDASGGDSVLVGNFRILDDIVHIDKFRYDFLHRVWPGEIVVLLKKKERKLSGFHSSSEGNSILLPVRMPRTRFNQELLEKLRAPLACRLLRKNRRIIYSEKTILRDYTGNHDLVLVIQECCREHALPTVVDLSREDLQILAEGKLANDEIKSLYFLGQDDPVSE
jgi:tRNA A37 threonylcarbamoyladenosine synthetase subunit TsaC/SUA5/YrdC